MSSSGCDTSLGSQKYLQHAINYLRYGNVRHPTIVLEQGLHSIAIVLDLVVPLYFK
jgi:hypothetical protein